MNNTMWTYVLRLLAGAVFLVAIESRKCVAAETFEQVDDALMSSSSSLEAVIAKWTSRRKLTPGLIDRADLPRFMHSPGFVKEIETEYWFDRGRFRIRQKSHVGLRKPKSDKYLPETSRSDSEHAFDGEVTEIGLRTDIGLPDLAFILRRQFPHEFMRDNPDARFMDSDFWQTAGWRAPNSHHDTESGHTIKRLSPLISVEAVGAAVRTLENAVTMIDSHECLQIRVTENGEAIVFAVDPTMNYATRGWKKFSATGDLLESAELRNFQKIDDAESFWFPWSCVHTYYQFDGWPAKPSDSLFSMVTTVTELQPVESIEDDVISLLRGDYNRPGTEVSDTTHPKASGLPGGYLTYVVPADPKDLDRVIESAAEGNPFQKSFWQRPRIILLVLNGVALLILVGVFLRRRRKAM